MKKTSQKCSQYTIIGLSDIFGRKDDKWETGERTTLVLQMLMENFCKMRKAAQSIHRGILGSVRGGSDILIADNKVGNDSWIRTLKLKRSRLCLMRRRHSTEKRNTLKILKLGTVLCSSLLKWNSGGGAEFISEGGEDTGLTKVWNDDIPDHSCSTVEGYKAKPWTHSYNKNDEIRRLYLLMRIGKYLHWYVSDFLNNELDKLGWCLARGLFDRCLYKRIKELLRKPHQYHQIFPTLKLAKTYSSKLSCSRTPLQMAETPAMYG